MKQYVREITSGRVPSIESAVTSMAIQVNEEALQECVKQYRSDMEDLTLPTDTELTLQQHHTKCECMIHKLFDKLAMIVDEEQKLGENLSVCVTMLSLTLVRFSKELFFCGLSIFKLHLP